VPRQRRPSQNWHWGPKLPQMQNLGGRFVVFFLGGKNRNFVKVRGLKLQSNLIKKNKVRTTKTRKYKIEYISYNIVPFIYSYLKSLDLSSSLFRIGSFLFFRE